jgi:hypothetical protein
MSFALNSLLHIPDHEYRAIDAVSNSTLSASKRSPWHARHALVSETPAMKWGSAIHMAILEPERFKHSYVVEPKFSGLTKDGRESSRSGEAKKKKEEWLRSIPQDALVISEEDALLLTSILQEIRGRSDIMDLITDSFTEVSTVWDMDGIKCKARADIFNPNTPFILDIKSCPDASETEFGWTILKRGYRRQAAWYSEGFSHTVGRPIDKFYFLAVESDLTLCEDGVRAGVALYELSKDDMECGWFEVKELFEKYAHCLKSGMFPMYENKILKLRRDSNEVLT